MYTIIDKTMKNSIKINGDYPIETIENLLKQNHDIEVISAYSNTIKYNFRLVWNNVIFDYEIENEEIKL